MEGTLNRLTGSLAEEMIGTSGDMEGRTYTEADYTCKPAKPLF